MVLGKKNVRNSRSISATRSPREDQRARVSWPTDTRRKNTERDTNNTAAGKQQACWFYLVGLVHSESKFPQHSRPRPTIRRLLYGRPIYHCPKPAQPPKKTYRRPHDAHSLMLNLGSMGLYCRPQIPETQFACWTPPQSYGSAQRSISKHDKF